MNAADVLKAAADLLEREGWCQHDQGDFNGPRSLNAALFDAALAGSTEFNRIPPEAYTRAVEALRPRVGHIEPWNDAPDRTKAEVLALLRETAASLEGPS